MAAYAAEMSEFLLESGLVETKASVRSFVKAGGGETEEGDDSLHHPDAAGQPDKGCGHRRDRPGTPCYEISIVWGACRTTSALTRAPFAVAPPRPTMVPTARPVTDANRRRCSGVRWRRKSRNVPPRPTHGAGLKGGMLPDVADCYRVIQGCSSGRPIRTNKRHASLRNIRAHGRAGGARLLSFGEHRGAPARAVHSPRP